MKVDVTVSSPIVKSFRVDQVAGMFDLKPQKKSTEHFACEVPELDEPWKIGVIVGPSGSGKSTVARHVFGDALEASQPWPEGRAVVEGFPERMSIKEITHVLTSVGFSSPPSWLKPYAVLSNGEKFRADLARVLLSEQPLVVFDEFTSVVDRTVAKIGSAAISKAIRKGKIAKRFVAVTCHYDIVDWLEPDWVLDMANQQLARGCLWRRPPIQLEIAPVQRSAWILFRRHHYLSTDIAKGARCFCAFIGEEPVAFSAWIQAMTRSRQAGDMREHRTVVLPDYQGIGIGNRLSEFCASIWTGIGGRSFSTTSHPAMIRYRQQSPLWKCRRLGMTSPQGGKSFFRSTSATGRYEANSCSRVTGGFQYVGPAMDAATAAAFVGGADGTDILLRLITAHPGATVPFLSRHSGLSQAVVDKRCLRLAAEHAIRAVGRHSPRWAFYRVV